MLYPNLLGILLGITVPKILHSNGALIGQAGVDYYAEVHTNALNSYCHTIGMPFTIYGMLLWIPMLFKLNYKKYIAIQNVLYSMYMTHYTIMNWKMGSIISLVYSMPLYYAEKRIKNTFGFTRNKPVDTVKEYNYLRILVFVEGLMVSIGALVFQEIIGHWLSGDPLSRAEAVPNAIMYAVYYSVYHIF